MYQGFLQMAGVEIINAERTQAYVENVMPSFPLQNCMKCGTLHLALGHKPYTSPIVDDAPWFNADDPASGRFFGLYPLELQNFDGSTRSANTVESIGNGGTVGGGRFGTRAMRVRGVLLGQDEEAVAAGLVWLTAALNPAPCAEHGGTCGGSTICYYSACPVIEDCYYPEESGFGSVAPTGVITPSTSPLVMPRPNIDGKLQSSFAMTPTDGTIFTYGQLNGDSSETISTFGPFISQRTNYVVNPSFNEDLRGWEPKIYEPGTTQVVAENALANPNFGGTLDWTSVGTATIAATPLKSLSPPMSLSIQASGVGAGAISPASTLSTSRTPNRDIVASFYANIGAGGAITAKLFLVINGVDTEIASEDFAVPANAWTRFIIHGTNPDTEDIKLGVYNNATGNVQIYVDNAMIQNGLEATAYFDGDTAADDNFAYDWSDVANASPSYKTVSSGELIVNKNIFDNPHFRSQGAGFGITRYNWITNPSFENDTSGWSGVRCSIVSDVSGDAIFGSRRLLATSTDASGGGQHTISAPIAVTVGLTYTLSAYKAVDNTNAQRLGLIFYDAGGVQITATLSPSVGGNGDRMSVTATAPANTATCRAVLYSNIVLAVGETVGWDGVMLQNGAVASPYFDGSFSGDESFIYQWNGAANASSSTQGAHLLNSTSYTAAQGVWFPQQIDGDSAAGFLTNTQDAWGANLLVPGIVNGGAYTIVTRFRTSWTGYINVRLFQTSGQAYPVVDGQWQEVRYTTTAGDPSTLRAGFLGALSDGHVQGDILDIQYFAIVPVPSVNEPYTGDYFDGSTPVTDGLRYEWVGTPDQSDSHALGDLLTFERIPTGGVDGGAYATLYSAYPDIQLSRSVYTPINGLFGVAQVSFALRSAESISVNVFISQDGSDSINELLALTPDWQVFTFQVANGRNSSIEFYSEYGAFDIDQVLFESAHHALPYFDGDNPGDGPMSGADPADYTLSWVGEPNLSPSRWNWTGTFYNDEDPQDRFTHVMVLPEMCGTDWRAFLSVSEGSFPSGLFNLGGSMRIPDDEQAERFERSYHDVTLVSGPTVVRDYKLGNGAAKEVEFFITAGSPFAYGVTRDIWKFADLDIFESNPFQDDAITTINVVPNPKVANDLTGWASTGSQSINRAVGGGPTAEVPNYVLVYSEPTAESGVAAVGMSVEPGGSYTASVYAASFVSDMEIAIEWVNDNGDVTAVESRVFPPTQFPNWGHFTISGKAPGGVVTANIRVNPANAQSLGVIQIGVSGAVLVKGVVNDLPYFDGDTVDTDTVTYSWDGTANASSSTRLIAVSCAVATNDLPIFDPNCPQPPAKPTAPSVDNSCIVEPTQWKRYYIGVSAGQVAAWSQTLPTFEINSATEAVRSIRVRFYPNPFGYDLLEVDQCSYCAEFILSYIPPNTSLTVDGTVERAYASVAGGPSQPASNLLYGTDGAPMTWPSLSCGVPYAVTVDVPTTAPDDLTVSLSLTNQE